MSKEVMLRAAFTELLKAERAGDWERGLKTANRILKTQQNSKEAFKCKVVCLVQLEKFPEALTVIGKAIPKLAAVVQLEKAYCQYRNNQAADALATLQGVGSELEPAGLELLGQIYYRLERFDEAHKVYQRLLKETADDLEDLRTANLMACEVQLSEAGALSSKRTSAGPEATYEQLYNAACGDVADGDFARAVKTLAKAEAACRDALAEDEDYGEEEVEDEAALIRVQLAYAQLKLGQTEAAAKTYQTVLNLKPSDSVVAAVAAVGLVALKGGEANLFDTRKKLKSATGEKMEAKLSRAQKRAVAFNAALLQLHSNQFEPCRKAIAELRERFGAAEEAAGLETALLIRQKDPAKALEVLQAWKAQVGEAGFAEPLRFALAHLQLILGKTEAGIAAIESTSGGSVQPGPLSLIVALRLAADDSKGALKALSGAVEHWRKTKGKGSESLSVVMEEAAALHLRLGQTEPASQLLEDLRQRKPDDPAVLASLIQAYAQFNPAKAEEVSSSLATLGEEVGGAEGLDADALEADGGASLSARGGYKKKDGSKATPRPAKLDGTGLAKVEKKKKKRKIRLPKNYDPKEAPDPERWLPRFERSTYKKKKDKRKGDREIGRGAQGAVSDAAAALDMSGRPAGAAATPASPKVGASPNPAAAAPGPRQQRPGGAAKGKKKPAKKAGKW